MNKHSLSPLGSPAKTARFSQSKSPQRILVVEDDEVLREFNVGVLIRCGFAVDAAENGAAAWDTLQTNRYDLMVTDNNMPQVSGVDLLKKLHTAQMTMPVVMATGTFPREDFIRSPWLQPAAMLLKPYTIEQLLGTVKNVLRTTALAREPVAASATQPRPPADETSRL